MSIFINLSVIFWSLFPALMSYTQPASTPLKVELRQLVANSDLLIPKASPNENQPFGFIYYLATDITLSNGVATFTPTADYAFIQQTMSATINVGDKLYCYYQTQTINATLYSLFCGNTISLLHNGNLNFQSFIRTALNPNKNTINIWSGGTTGLAPISVYYMGAINITDLVSRGLLPVGLTDNEYKTLIDTILLELGGTFQDAYFYTETIADNYKWFSTGFVDKTGERDFIDYLGFFFWLSFPYLFAFGLYKLLKGVIYG